MDSQTGSTNVSVSWSSSRCQNPPPALLAANSENLTLDKKEEFTKFGAVKVWCSVFQRAFNVCIFMPFYSVNKIAKKYTSSSFKRCQILLNFECAIFA